MTSAVDDYLAALDEPHRGTLQQVREALHRLVPGLTEGMSYGVPAFLLDGARVAGLSASTAHLSYLPHSGSVTESLGTVLDGYRVSKGSVRFAVDEPLPDDVLRALVQARLDEIG